MKTLKECEELTKTNKKFIKSVNHIDGYEIISFNYQDGTHYQDFLENDAFHMRGLTFVEGEKFPMLDKFFNLGEIHENEIDEAKNKSIKSIQKKDDGALIGFVLLPNGRVVAKTKAGLNNFHTNIANKWLLENNNELAIKKLYNEGIFPLFECVSNEFCIVLKYEWEGLILIQARNKDLSFLDVDELQLIANDNNWNFETPLEHTLEELLRIKDSVEEIEGFIVRFEDDSFTKIKTSWYFENHAKNEGLDRMNVLITSFFNKVKIDMEVYENNFMQKLEDEFLKPFNISCIDSLKSWIFRDGDEKEVNKYKALYKNFLTDYALENNIENENTLIKLTLDNSIDDILPGLENNHKVKAENIQRAVNKYLFENVEEIINILTNEYTIKELQVKFNTHNYIGLLFKSTRQGWDEQVVLEFVKKDILKKTKKKRDAIKFLENLQYKPFPYTISGS